MASRALPFITATCGFLAGLALGAGAMWTRQPPAPPPVIVNGTEVDLEPLLEEIRALRGDLDSAPTAVAPAPSRPDRDTLDDTAEPEDTAAPPLDDAPDADLAAGDTLTLAVGQTTTVPIPAGVRFITSNDAVIRMVSSGDRAVQVTAIATGSTAIVIGLADGSFTNIPVEVYAP